MRFVVFWAEHSEVRSASFVGCAQLFTDKTATILRSTTLVPYLEHVVLLIFSVPFQNGLLRTYKTWLDIFLLQKDAVDWMKKREDSVNVSRSTASMVSSLL